MDTPDVQPTQEQWRKITEARSKFRDQINLILEQIEHAESSQDAGDWNRALIFDAMAALSSTVAGKDAHDYADALTKFLKTETGASQPVSGEHVFDETEIRHV